MTNASFNSIGAAREAQELQYWTVRRFLWAQLAWENTPIRFRLHYSMMSVAGKGTFQRNRTGKQGLVC